MFKRESSTNSTEGYCPILQLNPQDNGAKTNDVLLTRDAEPERSEDRGELFVMAANIYYRARRNTRARAAGIL